MMTDMSNKRHRTVQAALLLALGAAPVAIAAAVWFPVRAMIAERESLLKTETETLARLRSVIAQSRRVTDPGGAATDQALTADFLSGGQDAVIVAELQSRLRRLAMANSVELNSANTLPSRTIDQLTYLGLRASLRGQLPDIQRILHAIETGAPLLFIERLALRVDTWPIKSADPAQDGAAALVAEFDVFGAKLPADVAAKSTAGTEPATAPATAPAPIVLPKKGRPS